MKDIKKDQNIITKIKNRKNETKSCFYPGPHSPKDIIQSGNIYKSEIYQENEMIDNIKKSYLNSKEINFIDEIMFSDVNRLSKLFFTLDTLKDFLYKAIFDNVYNLYTEKNANDLLNENFIDFSINNNNINDKIKKKQKVKNTKKKKTVENVNKRSINEIKKTDSLEDEKERVKEKSPRKFTDQIKTFNKFTNKKSRSYNDLKQCFFNKETKYFVSDSEMIRYDIQLDYENDLYNQEILIKNTVSKVLNNIYISLGESDNIKSCQEDINYVKDKEKKENKTKSKINNKLKKNNKKSEKKINKKTIESEKTDTDTEHSNNNIEKNNYYDTKCRNLIEIKDNERLRKNKTCERKLCGPTRIHRFIKQEEANVVENTQDNSEIKTNKEESDTIIKTRDKSKKKKHRQKYKTNNTNTNNKNQQKVRKENDQPNEIKKSLSILTSTHSLPEKKGSFDKKENNEYKKFSTKNVVSKNFNLCIIGEKEKNYFNESSKNYYYSSNFSEEYRKGKGYSSSYNKFNNFGNSGNSFQYFNNRNLNYNRYMDESSMIVNNYNINFNVNIMNSFNIMQKIEGFYPNFYFQLHNELLDYSNSINEINLMLKEIKVYSISYVEKIIKQILSK